MFNTLSKKAAKGTVINSRELTVEELTQVGGAWAVSDGSYEDPYGGYGYQDPYVDPYVGGPSVPANPYIPYVPPTDSGGGGGGGGEPVYYPPEMPDPWGYPWDFPDYPVIPTPFPYPEPWPSPYPDYYWDAQP